MVTSPADRAGSPAGGRAGRGSVRLLGPGDLDRAATLLARAFAHDPVLTAAFPDAVAAQRYAQAQLRRDVRAALPYAASYGIEVEGQLVGVAIWHPPGTAPRSLGAQLRFAGDLLLQARAAVPATVRLARTFSRDVGALTRLLLGRRRALRRAEAPPCGYLALLATDPALRGRGLARQLLEHVLHRCDEDGVAVWLETTDPVNLGLYARFGFVTVVELRGGSTLPNLWLLRREARGHEDGR
ncbi:MAG: GNAT family N-acetyltransferase [Nitriliruptor sp.]|nr:MAG: GNAT family N-acetyltransferase [Nitriliruptor sp.]